MPPTTTTMFDRVVIIMFENEYRNYVLENPYMRALAASGIDMASYFGVMHPSNTNYVASIAGETCGITEDPLYNTLLAVPGQSYPTPALPTVPAPLTPLTVVDRIREKGLDWRAYMETYSPIAYPAQLDMVMEADGTTVDQNATSKRTVLDYPPYINAHNPFVRFQSIFGNREQWERIGTIYDFFRDCLEGTLPAYSWITPSVWGDGHWMWGSYSEPERRAPYLVNQLAQWLQSFFSVLGFPGPKSRIPPRTLVVVTFDESEFDLDYQTVNNFGSDYDGPNQIYTVLLGDGIAPRRIDSEGYNHYSLLKTIEMNFGLESLDKNDREANWFHFLRNESFVWHGGKKTPIAQASYLAAAALGDKLWVVSGDANGASERSFGDDWSAAAAVPVPSGTTGIAMAASGATLVLICRTASGLSMLTRGASGDWSQAQSIVSGTIGAFAITSFIDYGDGAEKLMLVYAQSDGSMQSQTYANGAWSSALAVGQTTGGELVVAALGTSLFIIYAAPGSNGMDVVSYNTAPFNVITGADDSNTTQYLWSPSAFPVAHYSFGPDRADADAPEPVLRSYQGVAPFAAATLDGVIHLANVATSGSAVITETFSTSGVFTPQNVVTDAANATGSNGWGTLAEAGWSLQRPIAGIANQPGAAMAMARFGASVVLLTQASAGGAVMMTIGCYDQTS